MNVLVKYFSITQQTVFSLRCSSPGALLFRYGESFLRGRWTAGYRQSSVHAGNKTPSIHVHPRAFDVHGRPWIHVHPPRGSAVRGSTSMDRWMDGSERLQSFPRGTAHHLKEKNSCDSHFPEGQHTTLRRRTLATVISPRDSAPP